MQARVLDTAGHVLSDTTSVPRNLRSQGVATDVLHPAVLAATVPPAPARAYFVELLLRSGSRIVDRNVYRMPTQTDVINWKKTLLLPQATMTRYASLRQLQSLPQAHVSVVAHSHAGRGLGRSNVGRTDVAAPFGKGPRTNG